MHVIAFFVSLIQKLFVYISRVILFIAVIVTVISFFNYFSEKPQQRSSKLQEDLRAKEKKMYEQFDNKNLNPAEKELVYYYRVASCRFSGMFCTNNPKDIDRDFQKSLANQAAGLFMYPLMNPPSSGVQYIGDSLKNAGFIPKTYAAEGIGFASIRPLMGIWKQFRNVAYLFLVLLLISIGFMIMFRMKINPQTVISIENALPKIITSMILIAFSFPIAGFLIDLMYIIIAIMILTIGNIPELNLIPDQLIGKYYMAGPSDIPGMISSVNASGAMNIWDIFFTIPQNLMDIFGGLFQGIIRTISAILTVYFVGGRLMGWMDKTVDKFGEVEVGGQAGVALIGSVGGEVKHTGLIPGILNLLTHGIGVTILSILGFILMPHLILGLGIFLTLLYVSFRLFFLLFSTYLRIILLVVLSPLIIMFEAIPGKSVFSKWFKTLLGEVLTFPIVIGIFLLGTIIFEVVHQTKLTDGLIKLPFLWSIDPTSYGVLLGFVILFMTPDLVKAAKKLIVPEGLPVLSDAGMGIGVLFSGVTGATGAGLQKMGQYGSTAHYVMTLKDLPFVNKFMGGNKGKGGTTT